MEAYIASARVGVRHRAVISELRGTTRAANTAEHSGTRSLSSASRDPLQSSSRDRDLGRSGEIWGD
eukprot:CAMPEP_0202750060 /NCGR_PEP_ID=MMETSP1388-20130828/11041_1 /ASSEMBLY_ACC=CAM_ASM_000864 /TAXON_ID=37098 /ORGANISM="Isochrysis sp, Strain CCMP1244" /LENGTH=65 /DNA_ID=CAMNT_0049417611 /DNA_START=24 /DNA_END=218 /DNA_ORIENTATION=+